MTHIPTEFKDEKKFILYQLIPLADRPGKFDKKPLWDWSDPIRWLSGEDAERQATQMGVGYGVGYVFTADSGRFFFDSDNCRNPQTGELTAIASEAIALFQGAYVEVSVSGTGIHIFGRYRGERPAHGCRNSAFGLELYTAGRWAALGTPCQGSVNADCTEVLTYQILSYFPPDDTTGEMGWTTEPVPEWCGSTDDAELIQRAMQSKSTASAFGNRASFSDLWLRNEKALSVSYPDSGGRVYDCSAADAALAQHLAWWTGNNCERIERLMRRADCGLVRDKWDTHPTYLRNFTILNAVRRQESVCNDKQHLDASKRRHEQIAENLRIGEGTEEYPSSSVLTEVEMLARYVNIIEGKRVLDLECPRRIFALDEWKSAHKSSRTVQEVEGEYKLDGTPKTKSYETTKLWEMNPKRWQVDTVTFRPGYKPVTVDPEGKSAANTWRPIARIVAAGDTGLFDLHVSYLFGADAPRFLDWLAHIEQRPGELPHTGWVHISPYQGTGRNWLASVLCRLWRGHVAASFDLAGTLRTGFNGPLSQKLLAIVDEINEGGSNARWESAEILKSLVTSEHRHINPKYGHQRVEYNACRWLIFSNHTSALPLTERDRRFNVVRNDNPPMPSEYYARLYDALKDQGFIAAVAELMQSRNISGFKPGEHALMNEAKRELVGASRSDADDIIARLLIDHPSDVIASSTLGEMLTGQRFGKMTPHHRHALERAGVRPYEKPIWAGSRAVRVQILRNHSIWKDATTHQIQAELAKGSTSAMASLSFEKFAAEGTVN